MKIKFVKRLILFRGFRRISTGSKTLDASDALDQKATKRLWKIAIIGIPLLLLGGTSSLAVHSRDYREVLEPLFPQLVQLLREDIGFDDEDPKERERIRCLLDYYDRDQEVLLINGRGETLAAKTVAGRESVKIVSDALHQEANRQDATLRITFSDCGLGAGGDKILVVPNLMFQKSLWNEHPGQKDRKSYSSLNPDHLKLFQLIFPPNILSNRLAWLQQYELFPDTQFVKIKQNRNQKQSGFEKRYMDESIQRLQAEVNALNNEKKFGIREIDQIELEIKQLERKISELKWKKWSPF